MNAAINLKLEAIRTQLEGNLTEASKDSYANALDAADESFLTGVSKLLKKALGNKVELVVKRGNSTAWLEGKGVDSSDLEIDFVLSLGLKGPYDAELYFTGNHAMNGKLDSDRKFKTGELTHDVAAKVVLQYFS